MTNDATIELDIKIWKEERIPGENSNIFLHEKTHYGSHSNLSKTKCIEITRGFRGLGE